MIRAFGLFAIALLMIAAAVAVLLPGFFRRHAPLAESNAERRENIRAARERLRELRDRRDAGLIGDREAEEYEREIEAQLLQEVEGQDPAPAGGVSGLSRPDLAGAAVAAGFLLLAAPAFYALTGSPELVAPEERRGAARGETLLSAARKLEEHIGENPRDGEAVAMLASVRMRQGDFGEAAPLYARAREIQGDTPELLAAHMDALINGGADAGPVAAVALATVPDNPLIQWMAGRWARSEGRLEEALGHWRRSRDALGNRPEERRQVEAALLNLQAEIAAAAGGAGAAPAADAAAAESGGNRVGVFVSVAADLAPQISPQDVVYVFARAAQGPRMPLAAQRLPASALPLSLSLDDGMAMMPDLTMSAFGSYVVEARVSRTGDVIPSPGDLYGRSAAAAGEQIALVIDSVIKEDPSARSGSAPGAAPESARASGLLVDVSLADDLRDMVDPGDTLFVFAKAAGGPPMPLAVHRAEAAALPAQIALDDSMAMTPQMRLSSFDSYTVEARISKSGQARAAPGDLYGETTAKPGESVSVRIDKVKQ